MANIDYNREIQELYDKYYPQILLFCSRRLNNPTLGEECAQETFVSLARKIPKLDLSKNIKCWLFVAAENEVYNTWKREKRQAEAIEKLKNLHTDNTCTLQDVVNDIRYDILTSRSFLEKVIPLLNKKDQKLFRLIVFKRMERNEIAKSLNVSNKVLNNKIYRLKYRLKDILTYYFEV